MRQTFVVAVATLVLLSVLLQAPSFMTNADPVDSWPMFRHNLNRTGYSASTAPDTNEISWSYTTGQGVFSSPAIDEGKVYVGSYDYKVYCLNATDGALVWSYTAGGAVYSSPAVADGRVYVGSYDCKVYAFGLPPPKPRAVGGYSVAHRFEILAPAIGYLSIMTAITISIVCARHKRKRSRSLTDLSGSNPQSR